MIRDSSDHFQLTATALKANATLLYTTLIPSMAWSANDEMLLDWPKRRPSDFQCSRRVAFKNKVTFMMAHAADT